MLQVQKRDGRAEAVDRKKIFRAVERACKGLEDVNPRLLADDALAQLFDGIRTEDVERATVLAAVQRIPLEPNYSLVAARLLLQSLYRDAFQKTPDHRSLRTDYKKAFKENLRLLVEIGRFDPRMTSAFDLDRLADAIEPERDNLLKYLAVRTLQDRYVNHLDGRRLEPPQSFWMRVAMGVSLLEQDPTASAIRLYNLYSTLCASPATPTLLNSGKAKPQLSSCFVNTLEDSIDGIYGTLHSMSRLSKYGGGLGLDITPLRGINSFIKGTNGHSQGIVPWARQFNDMILAVNQGGARKGACALYLETWHIDVEDFIDLRKTTGEERRRCRDINTAHWVPDEFMRRVETDLEWTLFSPDEVPGLHEAFGEKFVQLYSEYERKAKEGLLKNTKTVKAKDLWRKMLVALKETGHPWITFKDAGNIPYQNQHAGVINSTQLCVEVFIHTSHTKWADGDVVERGETATCFPAGTMVLTESGNLPIEECDGKRVYTHFVSDKDFTVSPTYRECQLISQGVKSVYRLRGRGKFEVEATANHRFLVRRRPGTRRYGRRRDASPIYEWVPLSSLQVDDVVVAPTTKATPMAAPSRADSEYLAAGWMLGDGWQTSTFGAVFGPEDQVAKRVVSQQIRDWYGPDAKRIPKGYTQENGVTCLASAKTEFQSMLVSQFGFKRCRGPQKRIATQVMCAESAKAAAFLGGLFSADGCVQEGNVGGSMSVELSSASLGLLQDAMLLLKNYGIHGRIVHGAVKGRNGRKQGALRIMCANSIRNFAKYIGFPLAPEKQDLMNLLLEVKSDGLDGFQHTQVVSVEYVGEKEVFDLSVPIAHHFVANGMIVHNCNLSSINVGAYAGWNGEIDYDNLAHDIQQYVRALDNVIDLNYYPTKETANANQKYRPIGLGVMGWHDLLLKKNLPFDSEEAIRLAGELQEFIAYHATLASIQLAAERGTYPGYDGSNWSKGVFPHEAHAEFLRNHRGLTEAFAPKQDWEHVRHLMYQHGIRNSLLQAVAPTATISSFLGCSEGIGPITAPLYVYETISGAFLVLNEHFVSHMKRLGKWSPAFAAELARNDGDVSGMDLPEDVKRLYRVNYDLDQRRMMDATSARQLWIDQGQSHNVYYRGKSLKEMSEFYFHAWRSGLKSTYYLHTEAASKVSKHSTVTAHDEAHVEVHDGVHDVVAGAADELPERTCPIDGSCDACQ